MRAKKIILRGHGIKVKGKLALCASESGYMSHGRTKLSKVLTLSGLRAPMPLVRNIVAITYAYGNFLTKYICYFRKKYSTFGTLNKCST
nr:MAG TPA: hypothetical protein [Microviridae sp.]